MEKQGRETSSEDAKIRALAVLQLLRPRYSPLALFF
jgi:hypothetical protein